jgi:hypothetical protein
MDADELRKGEDRRVVAGGTATEVENKAERLDVEVGATGLGTTDRGFDVELTTGVCWIERDVATGACVVTTCEDCVEVHTGVNVDPAPVTVDWVAALDTVRLAELDSSTSGSTGRGIMEVGNGTVTGDATKH